MHGLVSVSCMTQVLHVGTKLHLPASLQDEADEEPEALDAEAEQDDTDGEPISEGRDEL